MKTKDAPPLVLTYTNHRGETGVRRIIPLAAPWWGQSDYHVEPQWLLRAFDVDKQVEREFALKDFGASFQARVQPWMMACFGPEVSGDREERNHRFLEEALELVQACGCTASEAHQLVDYTFARDVGEPRQETGGVMVTLAALCLANDLDMHEAAEVELARIWTKIEKIRAKQAAKPKHSPLPSHVETGDAGESDAARWATFKVGVCQGPLIYMTVEDWTWVAGLVERALTPPSTSAAAGGTDDGWRSVKTAPKDGTPVLMRRKLKRPFVGWWETKLAGYDGHWSDGWGAPHRDPTLWRPLPGTPAPPLMPSVAVSEAEVKAACVVFHGEDWLSRADDHWRLQRFDLFRRVLETAARVRAPEPATGQPRLETHGGGDSR